MGGVIQLFVDITRCKLWIADFPFEVGAERLCHREYDFSGG